MKCHPPHTLGVRMRMMPRECVCAHCACGCHVKQVFSPSSRRTTVESNIKVSIIYTWLVKTLHDVLSTFALYLVLFLPSWHLLYIDFVAFSFSVSPTVGCVQHSTPQNTYVAEDQSRCPRRPPLSRSAVLPCPRPPSSVHVTHDF